MGCDLQPVEIGRKDRPDGNQKGPVPTQAAHIPNDGNRNDHNDHEQGAEKINRAGTRTPVQQKYFCDYGRESGRAVEGQQDQGKQKEDQQSPPTFKRAVVFKNDFPASASSLPGSASLTGIRLSPSGQYKGKWQQYIGQGKSQGKRRSLAVVGTDIPVPGKANEIVRRIAQKLLHGHLTAVIAGSGIDGLRYRLDVAHIRNHIAQDDGSHKDDGPDDDSPVQKMIELPLPVAIQKIYHQGQYDPAGRYLPGRIKDADEIRPSYGQHQGEKQALPAGIRPKRIVEKHRQGAHRKQRDRNRPPEVEGGKPEEICPQKAGQLFPGKNIEKLECKQKAEDIDIGPLKGQPVGKIEKIIAVIIGFCQSRVIPIETGCGNILRADSADNIVVLPVVIV